MKRPGGFDRENDAPSEPAAVGREQQGSIGQPSFVERARRLRKGSDRPEADAPKPPEVPEGPETAEAPEAPEAPVVPERVSPETVELAPVESDSETNTDPWMDQAGAGEESRAGVVEKAGVGHSVLATLRKGVQPDPVKAAARRVRDAERQTQKLQRRETRRFTAEARRLRRRIWIIVGAVAALAAFVLVIVFTPLMAVKELRVEGAQTANVADIERALQRFDGVPLALVDENEVLRALEAFPLIQRFAVERVPPHTLVVRVEERTPVIAVERNGSFELYDAAGVLIAKVPERPAGVPLGKDAAQQTSSTAFREAAQVIRDLPADLRAQVVSVSAQTGQDVLLTLDTGTEVFWGNADKTQRKSVVLLAMLPSLADRQVSHIDVSSTEAPVFR